MRPPALLIDVLAQSRSARLVGPDIWSVMPTGTPAPTYDGRAKLYDRLIGSSLYNRVAWGIDPAAYAAFAQEAARSSTGPFLDAGCGTLVSTAMVHAKCSRPTVLIDLSIDMLQVARSRLLQSLDALPETLVLLQADIRDLPFRDGVFATVLCPGMLHLFEPVEAITRELARVVAHGSHIFASSLVAERLIGRGYLALLHRAGEIAQPRTEAELLARLNTATSGLAAPVAARRKGSMSFMVAKRA
jgi:SAM-dependent methyltransferase